MSTGNVTAASGCSSSVGMNSSSASAPACCSPSFSCSGGAAGCGVLGCGALAGGVRAGGVPAAGGVLGGGVPAGGAPCCCATEPASHAASATADAANLNQRISARGPWLLGKSSLQIARDAEPDVLAPF